MTLYFTTSSPHQWVSLDNKGIQGSGVVESLSELETKGQRCVAVVPGEQVNTRTITIPVRSRQKLMAAIPFAIEDSLISRVDDLHFTLLNARADNQVTFAYVSRDLMGFWQKQVQQAGISLSAVIPDYLLLPHASPTSAVISISESGQVLLRSGLCKGAVTDRQNLSAWLNELDKEITVFADPKAVEQLPELQAKKITVADIGSRLVDWLSQDLPEHDAVLLSGEFAQGSSKSSLLKKYWPAAAMILLAGFIKLGSDIAELVWLQKTQTQIEQNTQSLYQELFPGSKLLAGRARVQTRNKLMTLQAGAGGNDFTYLLVTTSGLLKNQQVNVEEVDYREGRLITVLTLNDFAHLDRIKQRLQKDPAIAVNLKQSGARGNKVQVRFEISRVRT
jgi:general secretion pathway protein L